MGNRGRGVLGNPYGNPCPKCGAKRYERCFKMVQLTAVKNIAASEYMEILDFAHAERPVRPYPLGNLTPRSIRKSRP